MKLKSFIFIALSICLSSTNLFAEEAKITSRKANELYLADNYKEALDFYRYLLKSDEKNLEYNFRLGVCYLRTNISKSSAIPYLKTVIDIMCWLIADISKLAFFIASVLTLAPLFYAGVLQKILCLES